MTDRKIEELLQEPKPLRSGFEASFTTTLGPDNETRSLELAGENGSRFCVKLRQNTKRRTDFSVVLGCHLPDGGPLFHLRRYNGDGHPHRNRLEGERLDFCFHIHEATERYQEAGEDEDDYAVRADRYHDLSSAFACLLKDCAFEVTGDYQLDIDSSLLEG